MMSGKANNLEILRRHGILVPRGFALDAEHYRRHAARIGDVIRRSLDNPDAVEACFHRLRLDAIAKRALAEGIEVLPEVRRFAVRSSGRVFQNSAYIGEDGATVSLAGQFESYLNVPRARVPSAVRRCWASLFNARSLERFAADEAYVAKSEMTVVIQEMVVARASAVMMTCDPQADGNAGAIESAWGPCEAIVGGMVNPDEFRFDRRTGTVLSASIGSKSCAVRYRAFMPTGDNVVRRTNSVRLQRRLALDNATVARLIETGFEIERIFAYPQDIEAVIDRDDNIVVTQSRNVTTLARHFSPIAGGTNQLGSGPTS